MQCILMNKNNEVLIAEYDLELSAYSEIYEIKNIDYAPQIIKQAYKKNKNIKSELNEWFVGRGISSLRDDLDILLAKLNVSTSTSFFSFFVCTLLYLRRSP